MLTSFATSLADLPSAPTILAYLDPGTGSMALQVLLAGVLSGLYYMRSSFSFLKQRLVGSRGR